MDLATFQAECLPDISRFAKPEDHVAIMRGSDGVFGAVFYTSNTRYSIRVSSTYMGCTASSRKPRAGEDWTRGRDLADGPATVETWRRILGEIVSYEMVRIAKQVQPEAVPEGDGIGEPLQDGQGPASVA